MGVNNEKYFYLNRVGLLRDSWALEQFAKDAKQHHMEDQLGKLAALRLTEYYELKDQLNAALAALGQRGIGTELPALSASSGQKAPQPSASAHVARKEQKREATTASTGADDGFLADVDAQWDM